MRRPHGSAVRYSLANTNVPLAVAGYTDDTLPRPPETPSPPTLSSPRSPSKPSPTIQASRPYFWHRFWDDLQRRRDELSAEMIELSAQLGAVVGRLSPPTDQADTIS
jgi:hypothetical protein